MYLKGLKTLNPIIFLIRSCQGLCAVAYLASNNLKDGSPGLQNLKKLTPSRKLRKSKTGDHAPDYETGSYAMHWSSISNCLHFTRSSAC
jgi:hypothetical protein